MKCLVIQTAYLGDVILTLPLLRLLRESSDVDALAVLTTPVGAEFLRGQNAADRILVYDKRGRDEGVSGFRRTVTDTRTCGFGLAVLPHRSFRSALLAVLSLIPERIGFDESGGRALLTKRVGYRARPHEVERMAGLAAAAGVEVPSAPLPFRVVVPERGAREIEEVLTSRGVGEKERLVVVAPGSRWKTKKWGAERFGEAASALAAESDLVPVVTGSALESEDGAAAALEAGGCAVDLTGSLSLEGWIALMGRAAVVLSNDSAAAHVAAGVGTPVVAVFGPTVPSQGFAPYSARARVVEAPLDCRPCGRHGSDDCRVGSHACMSSVSVDEVVSAARNALLEEDVA